MVLIDNTFLSLMLYPLAKPPQDPSTKKPVDRIEDRIEKLLDDLDSESQRIILPTPVLSEFLILVGKDAPGYLDKLSAMKNVLIKPFDTVAAIELADVEVEDRAREGKRGGGHESLVKTQVRPSNCCNSQDQRSQPYLFRR